MLEEDIIRHRWIKYHPAVVILDGVRQHWEDTLAADPTMRDSLRDIFRRYEVVGEPIRSTKSKD